MSNELIMEPQEMEFTPLHCKLTVERTERTGGDFLKNIGGAGSEKRVTFDGDMTPELASAIVDAMRQVLE